MRHAHDDRHDDDAATFRAIREGAASWFTSDDSMVTAGRAPEGGAQNPPATPAPTTADPTSAAAVVRRFYEGVGLLFRPKGDDKKK